MPSVTLLSKEQESQLMNALTGAITDVNSGTDANDALAKHANDHGFGPEFAKRMVEAYNSSKTLSHIGATTGEKRAESFSVADPDVVIANMYTPEESCVVKKADVFDRFTDPSSVNFNVNPETELRKRNIEKVASILSVEDNDDYAKPIEQQVGEAIDGARDALTKIAAERSELNMQSDHMQDTVTSAIYKLADEFRTPGCTPFHEVEYRVHGTYGDLGKQAMDIVWGTNDFVRHGERRATKEASTPVVMGEGPTYAAARELMVALNGLMDKRAALKEFESNANALTEWFNTNVNRLQKHGAGVGFTDVTNQPVEEQDIRRAAGKPGLEMNTQPIEPVQQAAKSPKQPDLKSLLAPATAGTSIVDSILPEGSSESITPITPQHESRIRQVRAKLMLSDMLANDPVISAYAPDDVFSAYNELSELAPSIASEPLLMRSMIARVLQTGNQLESHEVSDLMRAEEGRRRTRILGH